MNTKDSGSILVVDDDAAVGKVLVAQLRQAGLEASHVMSGAAALAALEDRPWDGLISDVRMPGMDGMELLQRVRLKWPKLPVAMLTAHGTVQLAVDAIKAGASEFMLKPFDREELLFVVHKMLAISPSPVAAPPPTSGSAQFLGESEQMREVFDLIRRAARSKATVLVRGESGTGKELVARAIHAQSPRREGPFIKVHCGGLPEALLESELFGYEKGAFTGAVRRKPGRLELADRGTLFLDEIGDVTPATQVKLLRMLQDRQFERLGGTQTLSVDVRFVSATHRDLEAMMEAGEFREDLFYRLNVVPIWLPPLRERGDDIGALARHFCRQLGRENGRPGLELEDAACRLLCQQVWKGNVRQLQNMIERLVVLTEGPSITQADVAHELTRGRSRLTTARETDLSGTLEDTRRAAELDAVVKALKGCGNNRTQAARVLGVSRRTLYNKLVEHKLV